MYSFLSDKLFYLNYIQKNCTDLEVKILTKIETIIEKTYWDNPNSSLDWNNVGVLTLLEAEQYTDDLDARYLYLEIAFEAFNNGLNIDNNPLCAAHLALVHSMIGETEVAIDIAFHNFLASLQPAFFNTVNSPLGLLYLSEKTTKISNVKFIKECFQVENNYQQALCLLSEILYSSQLVFYNSIGRRFLHLAVQVIPYSISILLKVGISSLMNGEWEGLFYLHQAFKLTPDYPPLTQALYLAYKDLNQLESAEYWRSVADDYYKNNPQILDWQWSQLLENNNFTYVPFVDNFLIAVEPSFRSIVTSVLIAEGDWFEKEMEFWRNYIKPGMTVIDVGANAGVYTFSAAVKVGSEGRVIAVEPFSACVRCLQETCRINHFSWVSVCAGAASDFNGTLRLMLHSASELNEVITSDNVEEELPPGSFEQVASFTLDSLVEKENLQQVDLIKIDAEGHEMAVLAGSSQILSQFAPAIMYENIAGSKESNYQVAEYLVSQGYQLFKYQPYLQQLMPIDSLSDIGNSLNIIAFSTNTNVVDLSES
jgi:FkbM family methyltransferase